MQNIKKLTKAINLIKDRTKPDLTVLQAAVYLDVAQRHPEPQTYADMSVRIGLHEGSISKYCKMLGDHFVKSPTDKDKITNKGFGLLSVDRNPLNTRQLLVTLSRKGESLATQLDKMLT